MQSILRSQNNLQPPIEVIGENAKASESGPAQIVPIVYDTKAIIHSIDNIGKKELFKTARDYLSKNPDKKLKDMTESTTDLDLINLNMAGMISGLCREYSNGTGNVTKGSSLLNKLKAYEDKCDAAIQRDMDAKTGKANKASNLTKATI